MSLQRPVQHIVKQIKFQEKGVVANPPAFSPDVKQRQWPRPHAMAGQRPERQWASLQEMFHNAPPQPATPPVVSVPAADTVPGGRTNRAVLGCGVALVLAICFCGALAIFLDSYNDGQYWDGGGLRPLWETLLGPFGFNPLCP